MSKKMDINIVRELYLSDSSMSTRQLANISGWSESKLQKQCTREGWRMLRDVQQDEEAKKARRIGAFEYKATDLGCYMSIITFITKYLEEQQELGLDVCVKDYKMMVELLDSVRNTRNIITGIEEKESTEESLQGVLLNLANSYKKVK